MAPCAGEGSSHGPFLFVGEGAGWMIFAVIEMCGIHVPIGRPRKRNLRSRT